MPAGSMEVAPRPGAEAPARIAELTLVKLGHSYGGVR
jgi:hypothetical protein